jgi:hypothetical protein
MRWVSQLMKPGRHEWDEQVLKYYLFPHDVEAILRIHLSQRDDEDILAWHYEKSGDIHSQDNAYQLAINNEHTGK